MGAAFREHFRRPTPGCARANHNDIVFGFGHHFDDILLVVETIRDSEISRRDWMLVLLETTSILSVAMPAAAAQHDTHATATSGETAAAAWAPRFLSTEQNETLIALGERVIPGSEEAQCNRLIDSILAIDSEKNKRELVQALAAFDNKAMQLHQRQQFRQLNSTQQDEILAAASQSDNQLHAQFKIVKEWVADAYWSSLKGMRELGSTGRLAWDSFPGCSSDHPHN
jgi:hypothetical protein